MGVDCYLIQITERKLMDLDEATIPAIFEQARHYRIASRAQLLVEEMLEGPRYDPVPALGLENSWWGLHLFLSGNDPSDPEKVDPAMPLSCAVLGGRSIGDALNQGPARYLWPDEVRQIAAALSEQTRDVLLRRYLDPNRSVKANYDDAMDYGLLNQDTFDWLAGATEILASYYRIAAAKGNAMLLGLT